MTTTHTEPRSDEKTYLIRVKRKRHEDPIEAILVSAGSSAKKSKSISNETRVFKLLSTTLDQLGHEPEEDLQESSILDKVASLAFHQKKSQSHIASSDFALQKRRQVLSSQRLQAAKEARYSVINSNRSTIKTSQGQVELVDIKKTADVQEDNDPILCNLMPMVREYLQITEPDKVKKLAEEEYVFDFYYHDAQALVHDALQEQHVVTLDWDMDQDILVAVKSDDEDSNYDSEDSNGNTPRITKTTPENFYRNDYPDEDEWKESDSDDLAESSDAYGDSDVDDYRYY